MNKIITVMLGLLLSTSSASAIEHFELYWANSPEGTSVYNSADHEGSVFLLEFFQLRCGFCVASIPYVNQVAEHFSEDEQVQILDIGLAQSQRNLSTWQRRYGIEHPVLGGRRYLAEQLRIDATPIAVVLDCQMNERYRHRGLWDESAVAEVTEVIATLREEPACALADEEDL